MNEAPRNLRPIVGLIGFLLLIWMLRAASAVVMPLAVAAFVVILVWPLHAWLERRLPPALSVAVTVTALLMAFAALGTVLWLCAGEIASKAGQFQQMFEAFIARLDATLTHYRLPNFMTHFNADRMVERVMSVAGSFAVGTYQFGGLVMLIIVFVVLMLIEVQPLSRRLQERLDKEKSEKILDVARSTSSSIRRFMLTRTLTSTIVGLLAGIFAWSVGLEFPLVWGVLSFILNYVPFLGAIVAVIPPTLVALIQPGSLWFAVVVLGGLTLIHFIVGNYVDPLLQGHYLSLPPLLVFYAIVFWGWVWGIAGAVLGVPLTVAFVITCQHFKSTRWVADLLLTHQEQFVPVVGARMGREKPHHRA